MTLAIMVYGAFLSGFISKWTFYMVTTLSVVEVRAIALEFLGAPEYMRPFVVKHACLWHRLMHVLVLWGGNLLYLAHFMRQQRSVWEFFLFILLEVFLISVIGKRLDRKGQRDLGITRSMLQTWARLQGSSMSARRS